MQNRIKNKNAHKKGFVLMLDAAISALIFTLLLMSLPQKATESMKELAALQQANDCLRVWGAAGAAENEMREDVNFMFGQKAELWINDKQILTAQKTPQPIATEGIMLDDLLSEEKVKIVVYYN